MRCHRPEPIEVQRYTLTDALSALAEGETIDHRVTESYLRHVDGTSSRLVYDPREGVDESFYWLPVRGSGPIRSNVGSMP